MSSVSDTDEGAGIFLEEKLDEGWYWRMQLTEIMCAAKSPFQV